MDVIKNYELTFRKSIVLGYDKEFLKQILYLFERQSINAFDVINKFIEENSFDLEDYSVVISLLNDLLNNETNTKEKVKLELLLEQVNLLQNNLPVEKRKIVYVNRRRFLKWRILKKMKN